MARLLLYSFFVFLAGCALYAAYLASWLASQIFPLGPSSQALVAANWLFTASVAGTLADFCFGRISGQSRTLRQEPIEKPQISVGMTAYNDETSIGGAVRDFSQLREVAHIVVIDNNSVDGTAKAAREAGARVVQEKVQGYGACARRALQEALKEGNIICLVEGDQTFFASDLMKLLPYIENVDMVVGTRTTMEIVTADSQMTTFMQIGNLFVAKLVQLRYWGKLRLTDVGCTYRLIRPDALQRIMGNLKETGNDFSAHMILVALEHGLKVIECPIAFRKRVGQSKGVGSDVIKGLQNGLRMIWLIARP
ncbi:MAG TPA: glycosyltransferase family 2 protein [Candidatus Diapherotrites archaeon]|uniref:Glycosyltransferase family 2 protein n=1 Tax=Candidatus Iainarchaeum sp. TaxID=3101447 RepID=A0A7J4J1Y8_9ARCH|nr:glycosyltransferase family 2 protein [Candidatus Diapherotrites archaeon]